MAGENQPMFEKMETIDFTLLSPPDAYRLLIGCIIPRPIALISTVNASGQMNVAPFSFFNGVCSNPPTLMVSIARKPDGTKKDTLINIEQTGQFVVNGAHTWIFESLVDSAASYPYGESEFLHTGLTPLSSVQVKPPRVKEAALHFECELLNSVEIGDGAVGSSTVVFGRILLLHVAQGIVDEKKRVQHEPLSIFSRLGGISYANIGEVFQRPVPAVPANK